MVVVVVVVVVVPGCLRPEQPEAQPIPVLFTTPPPPAVELSEQPGMTHAHGLVFIQRQLASNSIGKNDFTLSG